MKDRELNSSVSRNTSKEIPRDIIDAIDREDIFKKVNMEAGWPPTIKDAYNVHCIEPSPANVLFTLEDAREYLQIAVRHAEVKNLLHGRWETLGCHRVSQTDLPRDKDIRVRVCLFNYSTNQLIEIYLEDKIICSVTFKAPYEHPESPIEVAQAIELTRIHPEIKSIVESLDARALLCVPLNPHGPSYNHRCLHVMFTERANPDKEMPVLFKALVDLRLQKVIAFKSTPCGEHQNKVEVEK